MTDPPHLTLDQRNDLADVLIKQMLQHLSLDDAIAVVTNALNKMTQERHRRVRNAIYQEDL
jgi:hypothetical protein